MHNFLFPFCVCFYLIFLLCAFLFASSFPFFCLLSFLCSPFFSICFFLSSPQFICFFYLIIFLFYFCSFSYVSHLFSFVIHFVDFLFSFFFSFHSSAVVSSVSLFTFKPSTIFSSFFVFSFPQDLYCSGQILHRSGSSFSFLSLSSVPLACLYRLGF